MPGSKRKLGEVESPPVPSASALPSQASSLTSGAPKKQRTSKTLLDAADEVRGERVGCVLW